MSYEESVVLFTDGSCYPNPGGPGGWAFLTLYSEDGLEYNCELYGGEKSSTNNRMEMTALLKGLEFCKALSRDVVAVVDSEYVILGLGFWEKGRPKSLREGRVIGWKENGWRNSSGKVKNQDLWEKLIEIAEKLPKLSMVWTKGHSDDEHNNRVDALALKGRLENT